MATSTQSALASDLANQLSAILHGAAIAVLSDRAFLRISGPDAARWLNGMVTNTIQTLEPGEGNYNFLLNAQGQIQGDCTIYRDPNKTEPEYILETDRLQIEKIQQHLDKYIIMDDVELKPVDEYQEAVLLLGPRAADVLQNVSETSALAELQPLRVASSGSVQITTPLPGPVPVFEVATASASSLLQNLVNAGASEISPEALEDFRILSGTPRYGTDIRPRDLPQETAQMQALHFSKGCYLGQEIVERIRSRGNVHRTFSGFELTGQIPAPGTQLLAEGFPRPVGEITSAAAIPLPGRTVQLALGYIRLEVLERKLPLEFPGGTATPVTLPYPI